MRDLSTDNSARELLEHALTEQEAALQPTLRLYVWRAGLAAKCFGPSIEAEDPNGRSCDGMFQGQQDALFLRAAQ